MNPEPATLPCRELTPEEATRGLTVRMLLRPLLSSLQHLALHRQGRKLQFDESHFHVFAVNKSQNNFHATKHNLGCCSEQCARRETLQIGRRE